MRNELPTIPSSGQCAPTADVARATGPWGGLTGELLAAARDVTWRRPHG
jgi:hypothetical protein